MRSFIHSGASIICILFFSISLCVADYVHAQEQKSTVSGRVVSSDKKPIGNITVLIKGTNRGSLTDGEGKFHFGHLVAGDYILEITAATAESRETSFSLKAGEQKVLADIVLNESSVILDEVVVTGAARKFAKKQSTYVARMPLTNLENPQVYTVVPKELFEEQISVDFRSAVTNAPGLNNITQSVGSGGVGLSMRMRGFSGASAAGSIRNGMNTNWVTLSDPVNLESIEVIKGPSGTLFGSALVTYGGLINRVTKKPFEFFKGEVSYSTGSWSLSRATLDLNTPLNQEKTMLFRVNAALDNQKTWQDYGRSSTAVIVPAFTYKVSDRLTFDFETELYKGSRNATYIGLGNPGPVTAKSLNDLNWDFKKSYTTDDFLSESKTTNIFAKATYRINSQWVSQTNFSNAYTSNGANYLFLLANTDSTLQRRLMKINSVFKTSQLQQNFIGDFKIANMRNRLLVGLDYTYISTNDNRWTISFYDTVKRSSTAPFINNEKYEQRIANMAAPSVTNNRDMRTLSAYASDVINLGDRVIAMASVRVDLYDDKIANYEQTAVSPKFGVIYQVVKSKVSLFGNYMNGYSNVAPGATAENPTEKTSFKPEYANQLEGGVKVELLQGKLNGTLSLYDIKVENKVRPDPSNPLYSVQDGTQSSKGFEADLIASPARGLHIIMGYGYNDSKYTKASSSVEGKRPYSTPEHVGNFWISYKLMDGAAKGLGFGFGGNMQSDSWLNDANTFKANGYTVMDATVFYDAAKWRLGVKVNNLADTEYWAADYWANAMPTRRLIANLTMRF